MRFKRSRSSFIISMLMVPILLVVLSACGGGGDSSAAGNSLTVVNKTDVDICTVSAAVIGTADRDDNILDENLAAGASFTITDLDVMNVDLVAFDCAGQLVESNSALHIEGAVTWEITKPEVITYERPAPPPTSPEQVWLVMLYLDADDELIEEYINFSMNEAELVGSTEQVQIVAQLDRFEGGFAGDGDWTTARRYYVTQDSDLNVIASDELMDLGEVNMADPVTLVDFVTWSMETYPADKYVLILSDHGGGYTGGWSDQSAGGDSLTLIELDSALTQIQTETGLEQFELIGFEACLMSSLEVYTAIAPYARYSVASEEVSRAITALPYAGFLTDLVNAPGMSGVDLAESIVRNNIDGDAAVIGAPEEIVQLLNADSTLTAVDLAMIPHLITSLDHLVISASEAEQDTIALARYYAQSYFSLFGNNVPPSFLDLGHLATMMAVEGHGTDLAPASRQLLATLEQVVIAEKHGAARPGSTGITVYFPNSMLYGAYDMLPGSNVYSTLAGRFARESLWDDFLLYHYTGAPLPEPGTGSVAFASENANIIGPGVGQIEISPISASSDVLSADKLVSLSAKVTGGHVAWVYIVWGPYFAEENVLSVSELFFLPADIDKEVNGVVYPDWSAQTIDGVLTLAGDLDANSLIVTNGTDIAYATFLPEKYGGSKISVVPGTYISASTEEARPAMLRFNIDTTQLLNMYVITQEGFPIEYAPQPGDQFTFELTWVNQATGETLYANGDTLTFSDRLFWVDALPAPPGQYILGATIIDLDGNAYEQFITLTVEE